jgi:hypothetical protein
LPLHIRRRIGAAGTKRNDVVDDIARAGAARGASGGAGVLPHVFRANSPVPT